MSNCLDYEGLKALAAELGRPVTTLIITATNDPFYANMPSRRAWAEWFAKLWRECGFGNGVHVRRIHYLLVSAATPILDVNGQPYINTGNCWSNLAIASRDARLLGLVPIDGFVDRRIDDPIIRLYNFHQDAELDVEEPGVVETPSASFEPGISEVDSPIRFDPPSFTPVSDELPEPPEYTLDPPVVDQRYHLEIWAEKTTVADILEDLAREYRLNVVMGAGEMSLTHCYQFVQRAKNSGKAVRILYVSDFDPAGRNMPIAVARKIEFLVRRDNLDLDVQVRPVALTQEQCVEYRLPRIPIKETAKGKSQFEERFGEGATELDALEALHPGSLRQILVREIRRYWDGEIRTRVEEKAEEIRQMLDVARCAVLERHQSELEAIRAERLEIVGRYHEGMNSIVRDCNNEVEPLIEACSDEIAPFITRCNDEVSPILERHNSELEEIAAGLEDELEENTEKAASLLAIIASELAENAPGDIDWPEAKEGDEDPDPLYDSARDYVEQIDRFKLHQDKPVTGAAGWRVKQSDNREVAAEAPP